MTDALSDRQRLSTALRTSATPIRPSEATAGDREAPACLAALVDQLAAIADGGTDG